ncbi:putative UDP-Gal or UDP-GlcNAc-dependent glycosyltransferase [Trypanosoma rangeli]|uniref:Putative UDP-Gal or UDP-GlcNAc-dependent glycosyltransferase n=1 Tax=Trypanosoma rangeli TaxID=5698 RepID=A0A3R7MIR3_TRYRA|nr:putative UDP-Gal or UDP-GlcNAc-dependent glycosyltransferase [Trypanosoma rangeli]RNF03241.1 putative UDP-Gal or UDP-GlcNAc-dependent glycosyltransferase [Trypanosoma rangeli]|eukprot:RNF03241.1 putative UDP-Gal or UDP-GlcNAc-dependent glycosyltransferase [Trypanosoma rangeli]
MRKNPYLAHYFGAALDSSCEEGVNAATGFVHFPNSKHMTQRVFRPSRGLEPSKEPHTPVHTPTSNLTAGIRMPTTEALGDFPSSPPEWRNRLPPLSPSASLRSTPVEMYTTRRDSLHSDIATTPSDSPENIYASQTPQHLNAVIKIEPPGWDPRIRQSHAALAQVNKILDMDKKTTAVAPPILGGVPGVVTSGERQEEAEGEPQVSLTKTPCEGELIPPGSTSSCAPMSSVGRHTVDASVPSESLTALKAAEVSPHGLVLDASPREEGEYIVPSPTSSSAPTNRVGSHPDPSAFQKSVASFPFQTKCLVLTPNPDAAACALKRCSRRPPYVSATQNRESAVPGGPAVHEREPPVVSAERPCSQPNGDEKSKKRNKNDGLISVASLYGILERLANVMRAQPDVHLVDSNGAPRRLDASSEPQHSLNTSIENRQSGRMNRKDPSMRTPTVEPKVLMGNAPRVEGNDFFVNDHHEALNSVVPTSQLQPVGVTLQRPVPIQRRAASARRPSLNRAPGMPSYALPTESWLCKGVELDDDRVESSCITEGTKNKGALR